MKKTAFQVIEKAIKNSSMTITNIAEQKDDYVRLYANDGEGLTIFVEYIDGDEPVLSITDECNEDNFANMYPTKGNMRSLSACMRMAMDNIIENAVG